MTLQITIVEAQNLPRTDEGGRGKIDPFFKVTFAGQVYQTKVFQNELNPKFNETFTFNDSPRKDNLVFELYDDDGNNLAKLISTYVVSSDALPTGRATIPMNQANGAAAGQLVLEIVHIAAATPPPQVVVVAPPQGGGKNRPPQTVVVASPPPTVVVATPPKTTKSLQITIIQGKNLPLLSSAGGGGGGGRKGGGKGTDKIDPFFKVTLGKQLYQTKIFQNEQNPRYNETFVFEDSPRKDKVNFELYNNAGGTGQLIASISLDTDKIPTGQATLNLQTPQGVACGSLDIEIVHLETIGGGGGKTKPPPTVVVASPPPTVVVAAPGKTTKSLQITIIQGRSLPLLSSAGGGGGKKGGGKGTDKIDPFFKVTMSKQLYQTKIFQNEQNPRYNETFVFEDSPKKDKVTFELYNNAGGTGQLIASISLDTDKIPTGQATLNLQTPQGVACGYLDVEIVHLETTSSVSQSPPVVVVGGGESVSTRGNVVITTGQPTKVVSGGGRKK